MSVPFESEAQREAWERLEAPLHGVVPVDIRARIHGIGYVWKDGEVGVTVTVSPRAGDDATLQNCAYIAAGVPLTQRLYRTLASWTAERRFGFFVVDDSGAVWIEEQLVSSTLTPDVLGESIRSIRATALERRPQVLSQFGGTES